MCHCASDYEFNPLFLRLMGEMSVRMTLCSRKGGLARPIPMGSRGPALIGVILLVGLNVLSGCDAPEPSGSGAPPPMLGFPETEAPPLAFDLEFEFPPRDDPDLYHFVRLGGLRLDGHSGKIYAFEWADQAVLALDPNTSNVRAFGGEGDGPGEFRSTLVLQLVEGRVEVYDSRLQRITTFDPDGTLIDTRPAPNHISEDREQTYGEIYPLRHRWSLGIFTPRNGARETWSVHGSGEEHRRLSSYPTGRGFVFPKGEPEVILGSAGVFGAGGAYGTAGDSMVVVADTYRGRFEWHRVEPEGLVRMASRDLGWTPVPLDLTEREALGRTSDLFYRGQPYSAPVSELEVQLPPYQGRAGELARVAGNGDVWLTSQPWQSGTRRPDEYQYGALVVPMDPGQPVRGANLPGNFRLDFVTDSIILGVHTDPVTGEGRLQAYRIQWSR